MGEGGRRLSLLFFGQEGGVRGFDYLLAVALVAVVALAVASMVGVPLGPLDPAAVVGRALDALAQD